MPNPTTQLVSLRCSLAFWWMGMYRSKEFDSKWPKKTITSGARCLIFWVFSIICINSTRTNSKIKIECTKIMLEVKNNTFSNMLELHLSQHLVFLQCCERMGIWKNIKNFITINFVVLWCILIELKMYFLFVTWVQRVKS